MQQRQVEHGDMVIVPGQYSRQVMPPDGARPSSHELPIHVPRTNEVSPVRQGISHFLRWQHGPSIRRSEAPPTCRRCLPDEPSRAHNLWHAGHPPMPGAALPRSADVTRAFGSCYWETFGEVAAIAGQKVGISRLEVPCTTAARAQ